MGIVLDTSYPTSIGGAEFFFMSCDVTAGRKTIIHEYPNKTFRKVEDLGNNLRMFNMRGKITGFFYQENKNALETALTTAGIQVLVHPFLGNINVVCGPYVVTETLQNINEAIFTMNFAETEEGTTPRATDNNNTIIANLYQELYDFIKDDLNGQYIADFARNIAFAGQKLRDLSDTLNLIGATVRSLSLNDTDFQNTNRNFSDDVFKIASPDGDIGGNVSNLISKFDGLSTDGSTRFAAGLQLVTFGSTDIFITFASESSQQQTNNNKSINGAIGALAFMNMVDSAKDIQYLDSEDLDETADVISLAYDALINSETNNFSNELLDKLAEARTASRMFFEDERLTVNKVLEVRTNTTPVTVLSYQYTGSTDDYNILLSLNNNFNPAIIEGDVKVLEQ